MTPDQYASLTFSTWDRLVGFVRRKYPKPDKYGDDTGGNAVGLVNLFSSPAEVARIADALHRIDIQFEAATAKHFEAISSATKARADAENALLETVKLNG